MCIRDRYQRRVHGDKYGADFKDGLKNGLSFIHPVKGEGFEGEFINDKLNGIGKMILPDGSIYRVPFKDGVMCPGLFDSMSPSIYNQIFEIYRKGFDVPLNRMIDNIFEKSKEKIIGVKDGIQFNIGDIFEGEYRDNKKHGPGIIYFLNGDRFEVEFKDDKANGKGTIYYNNGDKFVGEFKDSKRNGRGMYIFSDNKTLEVEFRDDEMVS
eukprot:TRINITY_DN43268_c0_g1_i3.p2 TRINITY_DN43268_c0_g1~~TRINITY_DN43268_c0_g1_i3.p2  ORF type:complete len:210 (-),score=43.96 TRINITY_DN43268_c0_g1_i3:164-793(-)